MKNIVKIAKYSVDGETFVKVGYDEYVVQYMKGLRSHQFRITINGILTKQKINLLDGNSGYKSAILKAIKEYRDFIKDDMKTRDKCTRFVSITSLESLYSKKIIHNIRTFLLPISKEDSRDKLTEYGLMD
jgi:hypothetical protein